MAYNAFLSYSHALDQALAPALQTALHRLARPWYRLRALRVFRDKTSLAASPALWPAIEAALAESDHFLLMASPTAAASRWVQRELDWWLANRPAHKLLVLLTDGNLVWDDTASDFDWARTDALPARLRGHFSAEPLWVDLRWARSEAVLDLRHAGFRGAVLDIAAPLHGRSKDELDGDDVRHFARARRLAWAAVSALLLLTAAAVAAALIAVHQRKEAERQRNSASAGHLAAQADLLRERGGPVDTSVMLAAEALRLLQGQAERSLEVDLSLRRALALLPRQRGSFEMGADDRLALSADARHVALRAVADQVSLRALPGGQATGCQWQALTEQRRAQGLPASLLILATSPDGSHCATRSIGQDASDSIEIWSASPLRQIASLAQPLGGHLRLALSEGAAFLAISSGWPKGGPGDSALTLWRRSDARVVLQQSGADFMAFSPDAKTVATSRGLWRLPGPGQVAAQALLHWPQPAISLAYSRSGQRIALRQGYEGDLLSWDLATLQPGQSSIPPPGKLLAFSDDGLSLLLAAGDQTLLWRIDRDETIARLPLAGLAGAFGPGPPHTELTVLASAPDGPHSRRALVLGLQPAGAALAQYDSPPGERVRWLGLDGARLLTLVSQGPALSVKAWRWADAAPNPLLALPAAAEAAWAVSANGHRLALASAEGVRVFALDGSSSAPLQLATAGPPQRLAFSRDGDWLALAGDAGLQVWAPGGAAPWAAQPVPGAVLSLGLSDDSRHLLAITQDPGSASRSGHLYSLLRWRVGVDAAPERVALGRLWPAPKLACLVSADGQHLRAGDQWLAITAATVAPPRITPYRGGRTCAPITGGGLQATLDDKTLLLTDLPGGQAVARLEHPSVLDQAMIAADGRHLATLDDAGSLRIWALDAAGLLAQACGRSPQALDAAAWARHLPPTTRQDACGRDRPAPQLPPRTPP